MFSKAKCAVCEIVKEGTPSPAAGCIIVKGREVLNFLSQSGTYELEFLCVVRFIYDNLT